MGLPDATADAASASTGMDNDARTPTDFTHEERMNHTLRLMLVFAAAATIACGGQDAADTGTRTDTGTGTAPPPPPASTSADPGEITPEMLALGNEIFHGRAANAICYTCHAMDATGGPGGLGPNLTDGEWLNNDGSYGGIINTIRTGVPQPVNAPAPMPPFGGATLTDEQLRAVAAYVYSLSHPEVGQPAT
jgi:mono/diheme cytochrome c family protein